MMRILRKKGQNTAEYAILIGLVIAAVIAMQTYAKRGLQGRVYDASDSFYEEITGADWSEISSTPAEVLSSGQFEDTNLASRSTQDVMADTETEQLPVAGGQQTREFYRKTQQEAGDYQTYDY